MYLSTSSSCVRAAPVARGIEVVQVRHEIAQRVADLAVRLRDAREDLLADAEFFPVIAHRHPQPEHVGAALLDDVLRRDRRCRSTSTSSGRRCRSRKPWVTTSRYGGRPRVPSPSEQRALEPAAMLVAALEIHVGRPRQFGPHATAPPRGSSPSRTTRRGCSSPSRTWCRRIVGHASPAGTNSSTGRSYQASAPYVSNTVAAFSTSAGVVIASPHFVQSTAGIGTPHDALARDAPVRAARHHVVDAVAPPRRNPFHVCVDGVQAPPGAASRRSAV